MWGGHSTPPTISRSQGQNSVNFYQPIGTPFSTKTADDTGDAYDSGGYSQLSGKEWPSVEWPIQVVEIMYLDRWKVRA